MSKSEFRVNEIFRSIQGEGPGVGEVATFVRFSGCNLACSFCDTQHQQYTAVTEKALLNLLAASCKVGELVVFTGGEPCLYLTEDLVRSVQKLGCRVAVETNGTLSSGCGLQFADEVVVSPKCSMETLSALEYASAIKLLVPFPFETTLNKVDDFLDGMEFCENKSRILQPVTGPDFEKNAAAARDLAIHQFKSRGIRWRVIPQTHVFMGLR